MKRNIILTTLLIAVASTALADKPRPNILWINIDDQSPWYSSYGDKTVETPNIDALASQGVLFERAYVPTPVCSPSRSSLITGNYNIRIGAHDMRSGRVPGYQIHLPPGVTTVPELFRAAGYETYNDSKDDFNFTYKRSDLYSIGADQPDITAGKSKAALAGAGAGGKSKGKSGGDKNASKPTPALARGDQSWKGAAGGGDWRDVPRGKAFFGQTSVAGGKGMNVAEMASYGATPVDPAAVRVPPQYPDIPQVREHIATHYNSVLRTDHQIGQRIARLKADGLWENTIIFLFTDHGSDLPRSKEFVYAEGLHVPLIVVAPGMQDVVKPGTRRTDIVNLMDVAATTLALAGLEIPETMDAKDLFAEDYARKYVFSSADRMSNVIDRVRSVMGTRYHYIRNFMLDRPLMNWGHREMIALANPEGSSFLMIRRLAEAGKLTPAQAAPYGPRVAEELYDLENDPDEVVNLAGDPAHQAQLEEMRAALAWWIEDTDDKGQYPRSQAAMDEIIGRYPVSWLRSPEFAGLRGD
ncbi:MAG: sulfatase [Proteobacteria bacterium]|nr:sulfatase [Pseudomonadota bacterium]